MGEGMSKYDTEVDLTNEGTSHAQIVDLVGHNKRVLDVGCASGYLAAVLKDHGCVVDGAEMDPAAAAEAAVHLERVVVGDLEAMDLSKEFDGQLYDTIVFGDVLEHLRDPLPTLRQSRGLLTRGGAVVVSVPNIAHGAIRLSLLRGDFTYRELGLLDNTHVRFFTRSNLEHLMRQAGFVMVDSRRTTAGIFETELGLRAEDYPQSLVEEILEDRDATTYQFVVRAIPDDADHAVLEMYERIQRLDRRTHDLERERDAARATVRELEAQVAEIQDRAITAERRAKAAEDEIVAAASTKSARALRVPRAVYGRFLRVR